MFKVWRFIYSNCIYTYLYCIYMKHMFNYIYTIIVNYTHTSYRNRCTHTHTRTHTCTYIYIYVYMLEKERFNMSWIWLDIVRWHEIANLMGPLGPEPRIWNSLGVPWLAESLCGWGSTIKKKTRERERERTFSNTFQFGPFWVFPKILGAFPKLWKKNNCQDCQWHPMTIPCD